MPAASSAQRRWPPALSLIAAGILVLLVLPNPLRVPNNNPAATAEYAPVPGKAQDAQNANFGEITGPSSSGIGSGGTGSGAASAPQILPPPIFKHRQKNCVGNPPRQTEDPLSPPCVPFFDGDNGGATWNGVTKDEIKITFYNDLDVKGDMNEPWKPSEESTGHQTSMYGQQTYLRRTIKAQLQYFISRYQTYGRKVHVIAEGSAGLTAGCSARQGDADITKSEINPFAIVHLGDNGQCYMERLAQKYKIPSFGLNSDVQRRRYEDNRPYIWGFFPDQEAESAWSASFMCRKLYLDSNGHPGATAKFTGQADVSLKGRPRKFGFIRPTAAGRGPEMEQLGNLLVQDLNRECPRQGMKDWFDYTDYYTGGGQQQAGPIMEKYKQNNVTTVVCYCIPIETELTVPAMQNAASQIAYFPEWYWDHASRMFRAIWEQTHGDSKQRSFGVSQHWRNLAFTQQWHYQAYQSEAPNTEPNVRFDFDIYHLFLNLFQAIQAAGPNLTPESVERGMFTFNYNQRSDPFIPTGGYGPYSAQPLGKINVQPIAPYTFVDTAMGWWWDPSGIPPGGKAGDGCSRVIDGGQRYYPGEWPLGDGDLFQTSSPCSQDDVKITDPHPGDF